MACICLCLSGSMMVTTKQGLKRLDKLLVVDEILTLNRECCSTKLTKFYTFGHRETDRAAEFVVLKVSNGKELHITKEHLLFIAGEVGRVTKKAGEVVIGDKLYHVDDIGTITLLPVVDIQIRTLVGIYAPFTMSGDFLANGFLVACYADVQDFDLAHAVLAPLRAWYRIRHPTKKMKEGIHQFPLNLWKIRQTLPAVLKRHVR